MTMSAELIQLLLAQVTTASFNALATLTVTTAAGTSVLYICNNNTPIVFGGHTYMPVSFTFDPPDASRDGASQNGQLTLGSVDQTFPNIALSATKDIKMTITTLLSKSSGANEALEDWDFTLRNVQWNALQLTAELVYDTYMDVLVPGLSYDADNFPGCW